MKKQNLIKRVIEKPAKRQFDNLLGNLKQELDPKTFIENFIVSKMAFDFMRLYRIMEFESKDILGNQKIENHLSNRTINGFISYKNSIERSINASYNLLKVLKRDRLGPKIYR